MTARRHGLVAAAVSLVVVLLAGLLLAGGAAADETTPETPDETETTTTTTTPDPEPEGPVTLDDAVLAWELNDESNNKAFAPGTFNFLSAGAVPDPGKGGQNIVAPGVWRGTQARAWRARSGDVFVQKQGADGRWGGASFAGLSTSRTGEPLTSTTGPFSGHRVLLVGGTGTVDRSTGAATIRWKGSWSVVYYSGFTFFTVTDPVLTVAGGKGRLTATLAGYASDRTDPEKWAPVPAKRNVVLADLPSVDLGAADAPGFSAAPAYRGIECCGSAQVREGADWGSFPATFLAYQDRVGSSAFWYSSGGGADPYKIPKQVVVAYDAGRVDVTPPETEGPTDEPTTASPSATTTVNPTPPPLVQPTPTAGPTVPVVTEPAGPSLPPQPGDVATVGANGLPLPTAPPTVYALASGATTEAAAPDASAGSTWAWWLGSLLLLGAAGLTLVTVRTRLTPRPSKGTP